MVVVWIEQEGCNVACKKQSNDTVDYNQTLANASQSYFLHTQNKIKQNKNKTKQNKNKTKPKQNKTTNINKDTEKYSQTTYKLLQKWYQDQEVQYNLTDISLLQRESNMIFLKISFL